MVAFATPISTHCRYLTSGCCPTFSMMPCKPMTVAPTTNVRMHPARRRPRSRRTRVFVTDPNVSQPPHRIFVMEGTPPGRLSSSARSHSCSLSRRYIWWRADAAVSPGLSPFVIIRKCTTFIDIPTMRLRTSSHSPSTSGPLYQGHLRIEESTLRDGCVGLFQWNIGTLMDVFIESVITINAVPFGTNRRASASF